MAAERSPLDGALERYIAILRIVSAARERYSREPNLALRLDLPTLARVSSDRNAIDEYMASLEHKLAQLFLVDLVGVFEQQIRAKLQNAIGTGRTVLAEKYPPSKPFYGAAAHLARSSDDFKHLGEIAKLVRAAVPATASTKLFAMIDDRNRVAHGAASLDPPSYSIEDTFDLLSEIIERQPNHSIAR